MTPAPDQRPLIGVTFDHEQPRGDDRDYSRFPWYVLRENYLTAVIAAGGLPLPLVHDPALVPVYRDRLDGLIVTGGHFDIDPALFGEQERHASVTLKQRRTEFEMAITRAALETDLPVFGICGGQQLLHVLLGGRLLQHIPDAVPDALEHEQPNPRDEPGHDVAILPDTLLASIIGTERVPVNSAHHQAAADMPPGVVVNARAPDGIIEGIESPAHRFCLGVQWHPEFFITGCDRRLFEALVNASRSRPG